MKGLYTHFSSLSEITLKYLEKCLDAFVVKIQSGQSVMLIAVELLLLHESDSLNNSSIHLILVFRNRQPVYKTVKSCM